MKYRKYRVLGIVQGVCFRAATREQALRLQLTGWVRNREDGSVELLACGDVQSLDALEGWLWQGPVAANVLDVQLEIVAPTDAVQYDNFEIHR